MRTTLVVAYSAAVAMMLLAGCTSPERRAQAFAARCQTAGLQPQTEAHARCVIDLERDWERYWDAQLTPPR